jgi:hypothetical protein
MDRGHCVAGCEGHEPVPSGVEERIVLDDERPDALQDKRCNARFELRFGARTQDEQSPPKL